MFWIIGVSLVFHVRELMVANDQEVKDTSLEKRHRVAAELERTSHHSAAGGWHSKRRSRHGLRGNPPGRSFGYESQKVKWSVEH